MSQPALPPLSSIESFQEMANILRAATCTRKLFRGRPVEVAGYSGSYQFLNLTGRVMEIWHTTHMTAPERKALAEIDQKLFKWYKDTNEQLCGVAAPWNGILLGIAVPSRRDPSKLYGNCWYFNRKNLFRAYSDQEFAETFPNIQMRHIKADFDLLPFSSDPDHPIPRKVIKEQDHKRLLSSHPQS